MKVSPLTQGGQPMASHGGSFGTPPGMQSALSVKAVMPVIEESSVHTAATRSDMFEIGIELPSRMSFYQFNNLSVRHFGILEHIKLRRAVTEEKLRHQVDALSASQDHPAYDLTVGDLQFLMFWHRINDFKRTPYTVDWLCDDPQHTHLASEDYATQYAVLRGQTLAEGEQHPAQPVSSDTLKNTHVLQRSTMDIVMLDQSACEAFMEEFENNYGFKLFPPMIRDIVFALEEEDIDKDLEAFNRYAGLLNPHAHGDSLAARRHALVEYSATNSGLDIITDFERWVKLCDHGVNETVGVVCKECGSKRSLTLRVDPFTFFPTI